MGGITYVISMPAQHKLAAIDLVADGGKTIRDSQKNSQGVTFRWLSDQVVLTIAQPTSAGILTFNYWIAPNRVATAVHINSTTIPLPPSGALTQRRIAMLVFHTDKLPQTHIAFQFIADSNTPIAWAFTSANWQTITLIPHPTIWVGMGLLWVFIVLSLQRTWHRHWVSGISASLGVFIVGITQPVLANSISTLVQNPQFMRNWIVIAVGWLLWYLIHPRVIVFFESANQTQRLMLGSYLVFTILPPIGMLFNPEPANIAVIEQRQINECPTQWVGNSWDVGENFTVLSQCITDHIGWRSIMIRTKNELDYRLFGVSRRVYFGNNDFYFNKLASNLLLPELQKIIQDPPRHQQLVRLLQSADAAYAANNIHMILVIVPSKDILYPENLPWYAPRYGPQMITNIEEELRTTGIDVIPVTDILQQHKYDGPELYHKRDGHWNDIGAYYVAQEIVARIALHEQRATPWPQVPPVYHAISRVPSGASNFAALLLNRNVSPTGYAIDAVRPGNAIWNEEPNQYYKSQEFKVWRTPIALQQPVMPNLAIVGDSYSEYFRNIGIEWFFNKILWISIYPSPIIPNAAMLQIFQHNAVKYVVIEIVDVNIAQKLPNKS